MKRKFLLVTSILMIASLLATINITARPVKADPATTITINPASVTGINIGQTFKIDVNVNEVTELWSWKVKVSWNPSYSKLVQYGTGSTDFNVTEGNFLSSKYPGKTLFIVAPPNNDIGEIPELSCTLLTAGGANGSGTLATLTFNGTAMGTFPIGLSQTRLLDWVTSTQKLEITHTAVNGTATVIPEFSGSMILPVFLGTTTMIVIIAVMVRSRRRRGHFDVS